MISKPILLILYEASQKALLAKKDRLLKQIEDSAERQLATFWRAQKKAFLDEFEAYKPLYPRVSEAATLADISPIFATVFGLTAEEGSILFGDIAAASLIASAESALADFGVMTPFDVSSPLAISFLSTYGAERVVMIDATTRTSISRIVTDAAANGWSWGKTANMIGDKFTSFYGPPLRGGPKALRTRAKLVAVTEAAIGYEEGQRQAAKQIQDSGLPMEKRWSGPNDSKTSDACKDNIADKWIDIDSLFSSGHQMPPEHPGCRHAAVYRIKKDS